MTDHRLVRIGRFLSGMAMVLSVSGIAVAVALGRWDVAWLTLTPVNAIVGLGFGALGWTVLPRQPRNRSVWAYVVAASFGGLYSACLGIVVLTAPGATLDRPTVDAFPPADLPMPAAVAIGTMASTWIVTLFLPLTVGLALFPDGRPASKRWRWVARYNVVTLTLAVLGGLVLYNRWSTLPSGSHDSSAISVFTEVALYLAQLGALFAVASLVARYRRADATVRHQIRWIAAGGAFVVVALALLLLLWGGQGGSTTTTIDNLALLVPLMVLISSFWVGITKYRLYEIDAIISKSVAYLGLAASIAALYAVVVVVPLLIIGLPEDGGPGLVLPIVATAVVAILFEPIRSRLRRWANRLVYGDRATPQEVLSQLTDRLSQNAASGSTDELARLLAAGTGADQAVVWIRTDDHLVADGSWPADLMPEEPADDRASDDAFSLVEPVRHHDASLGALSITKPPDDPVTPADRELIVDVASAAALVLRNITLNRELEERAIEVRESRRRLIAAQDAERHRLERDLHDGAQQEVVALKVKLGLAKTIAAREGAEEIATMVDALSYTTQEAVDAMRAVAHGIYPPLLEAEGLGVALTAVARTSPVPLTVQTEGVGRHSRQIEETIYFCVLEAIDTAHIAGARNVSVAVNDTTRDVALAIEHDAPAEVHLTSVADRIDALGGTITATEHPDPDTTHSVTCLIPIVEPMASLR